MVSRGYYFISYAAMQAVAVLAVVVAELQQGLAAGCIVGCDSGRFPLTGDVVVTGVIGKGNYQCTWNGDWHPEAYDDYALLAAKLAADVKTLDVRGAGRWDEDWDVIKAKCPSVKIIMSDEDATGIGAMLSDDGKMHHYFNLAGQRTAHPVKGLYIVNGKKVFVR